MTKKEMMYEGKAKRVYKTEDENLVILEFKDDLTAFNAQKKAKEEGKGKLNCEITTLIFEMLSKNGIESHFLRKLSDTELLCKRVDIIPIEVVVRNIATGSLSKRLGIAEGKLLPFVLIEFYYKNDALNDPLINDDHALILELIRDKNDLEVLKIKAREINRILKEFFDAKELLLVDFKIEFGYSSDKKILLADEITPDSCRFWDKESGKKLDKDVFRQDLGNVRVAYEEVLRRISK